MLQDKKNQFNLDKELKKFGNKFSKIANNIKVNPPAIGKNMSEQALREHIQTKILPNIERTVQINKANDKNYSNIPQKNNLLKDVEDTNKLCEQSDEILQQADTFIKRLNKYNEQQKYVNKMFELKKCYTELQNICSELMSKQKKLYHLINIKRYQNKSFYEHLKRDYKTFNILIPDIVGQLCKTEKFFASEKYGQYQVIKHVYNIEEQIKKSNELKNQIDDTLNEYKKHWLKKTKINMKPFNFLGNQLINIHNDLRIAKKRYYPNKLSKKSSSLSYRDRIAQYYDYLKRENIYRDKNYKKNYHNRLQTSQNLFKDKSFKK